VFSLADKLILNPIPGQNADKLVARAPGDADRSHDGVEARMKRDP
jgi:hypothetical protein